MPKESPSFFERLTGARILRETDDTQVAYEDEEPAEVAVDQDVDEDTDPNQTNEQLNKVIDEQDEESEDNFSDEDTGEEEDQDEQEQQEGQLTVDVFQDDKHIVIQSAIAGVSPEDLDVSITNDMVTIRGERQQKQEIAEEDFFYKECYWGTFSRSIILPVEIDSDRAEAKLKNGILTIRIPKNDTAMTRKLKVKTS